VAERLPDRVALRLQLLAGVVVLLPGFRESAVADFLEPRFAVGDHAADDRPRHRHELLAVVGVVAAELVIPALRLADRLGDVARGCKSLPLTVSRSILRPSALPASGRMVLRSSSSEAGTKSFHLIQWTVPACANTGAWREARMPASPAPEYCRNLRRVYLAIVSPPPRGVYVATVARKSG